MNDKQLSPATLFRLSPLIRITLLSLYFALTLPLPFLSRGCTKHVTLT